MHGNVLQLCNLHFDCLSRPLASLGVVCAPHISFLTFLPHLPWYTPVPDAFLISLNLCWQIFCLDTAFEWLPLCSESLHFVGLAISACLLPSSPRLTCTANSSAALTATAPVHSVEHAWPCSAPLQPLLPLPFPAPPLLVIFCAHPTSLAFLPQIPICFPDCVVPILAHLLP
jgi:hypothetical protein